MPTVRRRPGLARVTCPSGMGGRVVRSALPGPALPQRSALTDDVIFGLIDARVAAAQRLCLSGLCCVYAPAGFLQWSNEIRSDVGSSLVFRKGAFANSLREVALGLRRVAAVLNHQENAVIGSTADETLTLREDRDGLWYQLTFTAESAAGRRLWNAWQRGQITGCSISYHKRDYSDHSSWRRKRLDIREADLLHVGIMLSPERPACVETGRHVHLCRL